MPQQVIACVDACTVPLALIAKAHVVITDPPYSRHVHANITSAGTTGDKSRGYHKQELAFGHLTPRLRHFIARCAMTVPGWSLVFSDIESAHVWRHALTAAAVFKYGGKFGKRACVRTIPVIGDPPEFDFDAEPAGYVGALPWVRWSQPQKSGDRPTQGAELVTHAWGGAGRMRWWGPGSLVEYDAKALRGSDKHRTQKPLRLMLQMVSWYSAPGETVFDPCAGRGTTGQACRLLDREFWGCECDPEEAARAAARLAGELSRDDLREAKAFAAEQRDEALAVLALPRTVHPRTGKFTDEQTRARATRRIEDADRVAGKIAALAA